VQAVFASLRRRTKIGGKGKQPKWGAVVFIQRFGDAMARFNDWQFPEYRITKTRKSLFADKESLKI
jgi:hypothetical protein